MATAPSALVLTAEERHFTALVGRRGGPKLQLFRANTPTGALMKLKQRVYNIGVLFGTALTPQDGFDFRDLIENLRKFEDSSAPGEDSVVLRAAILVVLTDVSPSLRKSVEHDFLIVGADQVAFLGKGSEDSEFAVVEQKLSALVSREVWKLPAPAAKPRKGKGSPDDIAFGPITINPVKHKVTLGQVQLQLTPTEFRYLETFARRPERALRRADLIEPGTIVLDRTVDVHVKTLRKKIGEAAIDAGISLSPEDLIQTVRGVGYRSNPSTEITSLSKAPSKKKK